jgi:hypothetical protein
MSLKKIIVQMNVPFEKNTYYLPIVGSVVIGTELGREDHGSIPRNCDQERAEPT